MKPKTHGRHSSSRNRSKPPARSKGGSTHRGGNSGKEHRFMPMAIRAQKHLSGLDYPANKQQIVDKAREEGADPDIIEALEALPDREYEGPSGISRELGGEGEDKDEDKDKDKD